MNRIVTTNNRWNNSYRWDDEPKADEDERRKVRSVNKETESLELTFSSVVKIEGCSTFVVIQSSEDFPQVSSVDILESTQDGKEKFHRL